MKKHIYTLMIIVSLVVVTACDRPEHLHIGVSQCSDDDWRAKMNSEIEREILFHPEMEVEILSANDNSEKQIADINYFIDNDFDAIIVAPNEAEALTPVVKKAYEQGIPVLVFDRNVVGEDYTAWQGADNTAIGKMAAEHLLKNVGADAKVLEISGLRGSTPTEGRHNGFASVEGLNIVGTVYGNWNYDQAFAAADSVFAKNSDIDAVYAHNDRMAIAAADAARRHGIKPYIIGVDGAPTIGMKAVADGTIDATFIYPTEGQQLIHTIIDILSGNPYQRTNILPSAGAITSSNVDALLLQYEDMKKESSRMEMLKGQLDDYWEEHTSQTAMLYAVILIMVLLSGLLFLILRTFWQHRRHQAALEKATASKLAFFTNVSHDLRTPLTLIADPVEQMANADNLTDSQRETMIIANRNVKILKRLINQVLDFRKYESGKMELKLQQTDMAQLIRIWADAFAGYARIRHINFNVNIASDTDFSTAIDIEKMERIFFNIVSNAFKFTDKGGTIGISLSRRADNLIFKVSDTGKGISKEDLPMIFDHFFQGERVVPHGYGIGLPLAKAFAELLSGTIEVESELGKGTTFTITLPVKTVSGQPAAEQTTKLSRESVETELAVADTVSDEAEGANYEDRPSVLVIDDNPDIRAMIHGLLHENYRVLTASNGKEGLEKATRYVPDLVICDVMMPEMDGYECCIRLKTDVATSHIPVLMLTACAMDEQRVEGYESGADGYVSKPFNAEVLKSRIKNLISNRKLIKNLWLSSDESNKHTQSATEKAPAESGLPDIDNEFYRKFLRIVEEKMGNPELNVEELASEMGLGRSQFYRKIKSLTTYSPVELLRRLRLVKARELMKTTDKTISEISYEVGFSTPAYFTKCYREEFGQTPSEAREN